MAHLQALLVVLIGRLQFEGHAVVLGGGCEAVHAQECLRRSRPRLGPLRLDSHRTLRVMQRLSVPSTLVSYAF